MKSKYLAEINRHTTGLLQLLICLLQLLLWLLKLLLWLLQRYIACYSATSLATVATLPTTVLHWLLQYYFACYSCY